MERQASNLLKVARVMADNNKVATARDRLRELLKNYPKTKAADEARKFLEQLDKK